jgi:hypothetical protein
MSDDDNKVAKIVFGIAAAIVGLALVSAVIASFSVSIRYRRNHRKQNTEHQNKNKNLSRSAAPTVDSEMSLLRGGGVTVEGPLNLVPRDVEKRIDYWNDKWRFESLDVGSVEFDVHKESGVVVSFSDAPNYPKNGYALILDERNMSDRMSMTYLTRLPAMDAPINANAAIRNAELQSVQHHIKMTYDHGYIEVYMDGVKLLAYNDPMPPTQISYVGFGDCGMLSGSGKLTNIVIH